MAVYDKDYYYTEEATALDEKLRLTLKPIFEKAIENGLRIEDIHYISGLCVHDLVLTLTLDKIIKLRGNTGS